MKKANIKFTRLAMNGVEYIFSLLALYELIYEFTLEVSKCNERTELKVLGESRV